MAHYTQSIIWNMELDTRYAVNDETLGYTMQVYPLGSRLTRLAVAAIPGVKLGMDASTPPSASELEQIVQLVRSQRLTAIGWHGAGVAFDVAAQRVHEVFGHTVVQSRIMSTAWEVRQIEDYLCGHGPAPYILDELIAREHCGHFAAVPGLRSASMMPFLYPAPEYRRPMVFGPRVALVMPHLASERSYPEELIARIARQLSLEEIHSLEPGRLSESMLGTPPIRWVQIKQNTARMPYVLSFARLVIDVADSGPPGTMALAGLASGSPVLTSAPVAPGLENHGLIRLMYCTHLRNPNTVDSRVQVLQEFPPAAVSNLITDYLHHYQKLSLEQVTAAFLL